MNAECFTPIFHSGLLKIGRIKSYIRTVFIILNDTVSKINECISSRGILITLFGTIDSPWDSSMLETVWSCYLVKLSQSTFDYLIITIKRKWIICVSDPTVDMSDYSKLTVAMLRAELSKRGLSRPGKKSDMIKMLQLDDASKGTVNYLFRLFMFKSIIWLIEMLGQTTV